MALLTEMHFLYGTLHDRKMPKIDQGTKPDSVACWKIMSKINKRKDEYDRGAQPD